MLHGLEDGKVTKQALKNGIKKTRTIRQLFLNHSMQVQLQKVDQKQREALMAADPDLDALIPAGGGGDPLQGAIAAVERAGKTSDIDIVSTDFLPDLGERLENGSMAGESGGHYCDPLISFMMVYNAIKGNYKDFGGKFEDVPFPYLYVSSPDDYKAYEKYFVDQLPYTDEELVDMSKLSMEDLKATVAKLSIEDAKHHVQVTRIDK